MVMEVTSEVMLEVTSEVMLAAKLAARHQKKQFWYVMMFPSPVVL